MRVTMTTHDTNDNCNVRPNDDHETNDYCNVRHETNDYFERSLQSIACNRSHSTSRKLSG